MNTEMSIEEFIQAVKKLSAHDHREEWIRWSSKHENATAKSVYNHLAYPEMLLWLSQAVGIDQGLIEMAESDIKQITNVHSQCAAIRKRMPWKDIERLLRG